MLKNWEIFFFGTILEESQSVLRYDNRHQGEDANNPVRPSATIVGGASARQPEKSILL